MGNEKGFYGGSIEEAVYEGMMGVIEFFLLREQERREIAFEIAKMVVSKRLSFRLYNNLPETNPHLEEPRSIESQDTKDPYP